MLQTLLADEVRLKGRREAAHRAFSAAVTGVVSRVWGLLDNMVLREALSQALP